MTKNKRDNLARELAKKYGRPYQEIRKEVCRLISAIQWTLDDAQKTNSADKSKVEEGVIINHFKNNYGN